MLRSVVYPLLLLFFSGGLFFPASAGAPVSGSRPVALRFTENKGQWNPQVHYRATLPNGALLLEKNAFRYYFYAREDMGTERHLGISKKIPLRAYALHEEFLGANPDVLVQGSRAFSDYANYYLGKNPAHWASGVPIFAQVNYKNLYHGIDLAICTQGAQQLKYDFIVQPHADAGQIHIRFGGAQKLRLKKQGLEISTSINSIVEAHPVAYQQLPTGKSIVPCKFALEGNEVRFVFPKGYDKNYTLVIDPTIVFSTYTGSTADNWGYTATYDNDGNMYVGGYVNCDFPMQGTSYPTTPGAFQVVWGGGTGMINDSIYPPGAGNGIAFACDMGISKFSADGTQLLYSTYLGGSDNETPNSLVVDNQDNLIVYGVSYSADYPVSATAYNKTHRGLGDIVITKFNAAGTALLGSTYVGGSLDDGINFDPQEFTAGNLKRNYGDQNRGEVNIDDAGNIYVASCTKSADFPTTAGAPQSAFGGVQDGCAFKLNATCSQLLWSTFLGGSSDDACYSLDIDPAGNLYVAGGTMSSNFPTTSGTWHSAYQGGMYDGFVALINAQGTQLLASSFVGTSGNDQTYFVKLDAGGDVYIMGQTTGSYPVVNANYANPNSGQFITKLNPALTGVIYSTVFGNGSGLPNISPTAFLVDTCENVYVAGWGTNNGTFGNFLNDMYNMPLSPDAAQTTTDGTDFYFFVLSKNAQNLLYASYYGGAGAIEHVDGGTSRFDKRGVIYQAICAGCGGTSLTPTTPGVWSPTNQSVNCNLLGLKIAFNLAGTHVAIAAEPRSTGCVPLTVHFQGTVNNAQSFYWDLGDGTSSLQQNPVHIYTDTGVYTVMLIGTDSNSCNLGDTAYVDVWVRDDSLSADFLPDLQVHCDSNLVTMSSPNYGTTNYWWSMGDGTTYTSDSVRHVYQNAGIHLITLILSDTSKCNLADTFSSSIFIPATLHADFTPNDISGCKPLTVNFSAPSLPGADYHWNFGDGNTASVNPTAHIYANAGVYTVSLVVSDTASCNKHDTAFSTVTVIDSFADASFHFHRIFYGCDSVRVNAWSTYQGAEAQLWDFGDGTQSASDSVSHVYTTAGTFTISHYLTDADMVCRPTDTAQIAVSLSPLNVSLSIPDTGGCLPFTADFTASSLLLTTDYYWFFGDGDSTSGKQVNHIYQTTGSFEVLLLSVDTNACVGADTTRALITVINDSVVAAFQTTILNDCDSNLVVSLSNQSAQATDYVWTFGDGTSSTQTDEQHSYTVPGTYLITLIASDTNRCHPVDSMIQPVTLLPNTAIDFAAQDVCAGTAVAFTNSSNPDAAFVWAFGDGTSSADYAPVHLYATSGTYIVRLTMTDSATCNVYDTAVYSVQVMKQPQADFSLTADTFRFETPVSLVNESRDYVNLLWDFGDGTTLADEERPVHLFEQIGNMHLCLEAANGACADTMCRNIFISFEALIGVPNAFSPNGDGINDVVKIEGKGIVALNFRIYNRWGEKVFETHDKNVGWDGYYKGVLQEMDTYTYAVEATLINGQTIPLKGNITLLR